MNFLPHSLSHTIEQGTTSGQYDILEQIFSDVNIAFLDGGVAVLVNTVQLFEAGLSWSEENFGCSESFISDEDLSSVR